MAMANVATAKEFTLELSEFFGKLKKNAIKQVVEAYGNKKYQRTQELRKDDAESTEGKDIAFSIELEFSEIKPVSAGHLQKAAAYGAATAQAAISSAGYDYEVDDTAIAEGVGNYNAAELITNIDEPTRQWIASDIDLAMQEGWSAGRLSTVLEENYAFSSSRADTIARTEIAKADAAGRRKADEESGLARAKRWTTAQDPCDICQNNEADGIIDYNDEFSSGDFNNPAHPNCYCGIEVIYENPTTGEWNLPQGQVKPENNEED